MGIYKKYVAVTLAALMMLAPTAALAQAFTRGSDIFDDVPVGHWADRAIGWAVGSEIVPMGNEVRFDLNGPVSRSEIVSFLHRLAEIHITAPDVGNGDIAVIADDPDPLDHSDDLWALSLNGSTRRLVDTDRVAREATWSPDGAKMAYVDRPDGGVRIVNADGTNDQLLADNSIEPAWSPDGTKIAYVEYGGYFDTPDIWVMDADGSGKYRVAENAGDPVWSPDGAKIAYVSHAQRGGEIWVADSKGVNLWQLTDNDELWETRPAWSPDGKVRYHVEPRPRSEDSLHLWELSGYWEVNVDGSDKRHLDAIPGRVVWSPDGTKIAYYGWVDSLTQTINVANADGTGATTLATHDTREITTIDLIWSPDSDMVAYAFESRASDMPEIRLMEADGRESEALPIDTGRVTHLAWASAPLVAVKGSTRFNDVPVGHWADRAIGWAVDKGITRGSSETMFDPDGVVSRAQIVTFLHRFNSLLEQHQESAPSNPYLGSDIFSNIPVGHWADRAIGWAVDKGITRGSSETMFDPDGVVSRAQIVTFLHRTHLLADGDSVLVRVKEVYLPHTPLSETRVLVDALDKPVFVGEDMVSRANSVVLAQAVNKDGTPQGFGIVMKLDGAVDVRINYLSTAFALAFLTPGIATTDPWVGIITSLSMVRVAAELEALADQLESDATRLGATYLEDLSPEATRALTDLIEAYIEKER